MNDNEGWAVSLEQLDLVPLKGGRLRVLGTVALQLGSGPRITATPAAEVFRDSPIQEVERALLSAAHAAFATVSKLTPAQMEAHLAGYREEVAILEPTFDDE